jgi:RimJ/RimL family protein N-acetyltransferase
MNLETERLIIRKLRAAHLADFVEYRSDPQVCEFQGLLPMTPEKGKEYIEKLKDAEFGTAGQWVQLCVELKATGKVIGDIGLKPEAYDARIVEWGVSFSPKYQRRGFARESISGVISHLFAEKNVHRTIAITDVRNASSIRMLEKLNFRREAEFRESFWDEAANAWRDEFLYAMLEKDWRLKYL